MECGLHICMHLLPCQDSTVPPNNSHHRTMCSSIQAPSYPIAQAFTCVHQCLHSLHLPHFHIILCCCCCCCNQCKCPSTCNPVGWQLAGLQESHSAHAQTECRPAASGNCCIEHDRCFTDPLFQRSNTNTNGL